MDIYALGSSNREIDDIWWKYVKRNLLNKVNFLFTAKNNAQKKQLSYRKTTLYAKIKDI
jgi:hypothetical protein